MTTQQKFNSPKKSQIINKSNDQIHFVTTSKSFRSKMFQKRALKQIPKIADKQITLHTPLYQKYLQYQFKLSDIGQAPQIWGCLVPPKRKPDSVRKNYLKRDIDTPKNIFRSYIKRKSKLIYGIPITRQFFTPRQNKTSFDRRPQHENDNPEFSFQQPQISQFFTQFKQVSKTARQSQNIRQIRQQSVKQRVKRYSQQEQQQIKSSKLFSVKPQTNVYKSRFGQRIVNQQGFLKSQQMQRMKNKSVYRMSLDELKESIQWKKKLLNCLTQSIQEAKRKEIN